MGTPHFALPSLRHLAASAHRIAAVLTRPDRPAGRGRRLRPPPVKQLGLELGLEVLQPGSLREPELEASLRAYRADLFVVVGFPILPRRLLAVPRLGAVNLHPSLLPAYRGAAPIAWALIRGEKETGLSTFLLEARPDCGDILLQRRVAIGPEETAGELERRLSEMGAAMVVETLDGLERNSIEPRPQGEEGVSRAPRLNKESGRIDWSRSSEEVHNLVRGANPVPGAFTEWEGGLLKVHRSCALEFEQCGEPGTVLRADAREGLVVATGDGALLLNQVQPAGKGKMEGRAFVRGYPIAAGMRLGPGLGSEEQEET